MFVEREGIEMRSAAFTIPCQVQNERDGSLARTAPFACEWCVTNLSRVLQQNTIFTSGTGKDQS